MIDAARGPQPQRGPLLTLPVHEALLRARKQQLASVEASFDLDKSIERVTIAVEHWEWRGHAFPYLERCKDRTVYAWQDGEFAAVARYSNALIKLVPTPWGPPTFEIDGIKMLPTARVSPYEDARRKVALIEPKGKRVLDTCGGLGYFAAWCLSEGAEHVTSFEKNADVLWLRELNPWLPAASSRLALEHADVANALAALPSSAFDAALHDPPRFGIAGELYSLAFYRELARVLKGGAPLFHYTGTPNKLTSGRDVAREVTKRLETAGFATRLNGDGVLARKK